jgi:hypothetical protein
VSNIKSWTAFRSDGTLAGHFRIRLSEVIGKSFCLEVYDGNGYQYVGSYKTLSSATQRAKKYRAAKGGDQ